MYIIYYIKTNYMIRPFPLAIFRAETCNCSLCNKFYIYLYHHLAVLGKQVHSNLVYYKHIVDESPYDYSCCSQLANCLNPTTPY